MTTSHSKGLRSPSPRLAPDEIDARLLALCDAFDDRLKGLDQVREFIAYNERGVAFEALSSYFTDTDDEPRLTLAEFEQCVEVGEALGLRRDWVDLITSLRSEDRARLPSPLRDRALGSIDEETAGATHPARQSWLERLRALLVG